MTTAEKPHQNDPGQTLVSLVEQLRAERDGLRQAMRTRSLIEQAKGILMARDGVTAEEAFTRLRQRSQRSNTRLVEVAAGLIADHVPPPVPEQTTATGAPPDAPEAPRGAQEQPPGTAAAAGNGQRPRVDAPATGRPARPSPATGRPARAPRAVAVTSRAATESVLHTQHLLLTGHLDAATGYDDVVAAVAATAAGWPPPASVVLALAEPDGALRIVAATGLSAEVRSQWHRVPPQVEVPLNTAARTGVPVWLTSPDEVRRTYPIMAAVTRRVLVSATLPLAGPDRPLGAVALSWEHPVSLDAARRSYLLAAAAAVAGAVVRLAPQAPSGVAADTGQPWLRALLDGSLTAATLLSPVCRGDEVVDFHFAQVNEPAAGPARSRGLQLSGSTVLTTMPEPGARVLVPLFRAVLGDGVTRELPDVAVPAAGGRCTLRAARLGAHVFATWRPRAVGELLYDDLVATGRRHRVAPFRWYLDTGELIATPVLAELLNTPAEPAPTVRTVLRAVDPARRSGLRAAAFATARHGRPLDVTVDTVRGRWLRITAERVVTEGPLVTVRGWAQDVTELRAARSREHRQAEARAAHRSRQAATEPEG